MQVIRYAIVLAFTAALSCTNSKMEEQKNTTDRKEQQQQKEVQSEGTNNVMKEADQKQMEKYDTVVIGKQVWMTKNLDVSHFRNGDKIPYTATLEEWKKAAETKSPAWCYYYNDEANGNKYGKLYNWYAVNDARGLSPEGWRVPNNEDWKQLKKQIGNISIYAKDLFGTGEGLYADGTNKTGFNAFASGGRFFDGKFDSKGKYAYFWSLDSDKNKYDGFDQAYSLTLMPELSGVDSYPKEFGLSVRCIR